MEEDKLFCKCQVTDAIEDFATELMALRDLILTWAAIINEEERRYDSIY